MGVRARTAVVGVQQVREAALRGRLRLAVVAMDASRHSLDKLVPLLDARRVNKLEVPSASELGAAVGRESTVTVGVLDGDLARGIRALAAPAQAGTGRLGRAPSAR
ncbi:MAG TPA: ribosomal L7Ae/L30e/S12e/Gadd45 family protein [Gemmatimonadales bacterium]|nr:ribosomal L7Ae/L30e/S12e/Gadd45 family protein [Gemmatimonadales bacterium]